MVDEKTYFDQVREKERLQEIRKFVCVCSSMLSLPLYLLFWGADLIYAPQFKWEFLLLRSMMVPICLAVNFFMKRAQSLMSAQTIGSLYTFANSFLITVMMYKAEGPNSQYYAGLNLVTIGIATFIPWTNAFLFLNLSIIYGPFLVGAFSAHQQIELRGFVLNAFFMIGTLIITLVIRYYSESIRGREIQSRNKLCDEIESREAVIKQKTEEALRFSLLAKQFSPQVVHSIASGKKDLTSQIAREKICAVFIDIVNSTDRVIRVDKDDLNKVLSMFMEDTMRVLLKYDITIDKFLGDGVLAFSNAPIQYDDYIERVINAALEIRARIVGHQPAYLEHWFSEFQIRVGISDGYANVGFYGSDEYFKSYTAIGRVVNLASRLCSAAEPNQILLSGEVARSIPDGIYALKDVGYRKFKGFEQDMIKVFEVLDDETHANAESEIMNCPNGHGILFLEANEAGIYVFKCRECNHVLQEGTMNKSTKAA